MKSKLANRPKQPTPKELTESLLNLIRGKWYAGDAVSFAKDRVRLLAWVVLWPAAWLNGRGVTISTDRYKEVFSKIIMEAVVHGTDKIKYRPAWLRQVVQSHFKVHGEEIYNEAKSARTLVESVLLVAGRTAPTQPDPIRELAAARSILVTSKPARKPAQEDSQPSLF